MKRSNGWFEFFTLAGLLLNPDVSYSMIDGVHPDDPVVFIGDNLTLTCEYNGTGQNTRDISGRMIFMRNRLIIGQQYITVLDVNKIRLRYPIKSTDDSANYVCMLQETGQDLKLLGHSFVEVEYRPVAVEGVSCRVYNWESMVCSWPLQQMMVHSSRFNSVLVWRIDLHNNGTQYICLNQTLTTCTWLRHGGDDVDLFVPGSIYKLQVIVVYNRTTSFTSRVAEAVSKEFVIDSRYYVEPAPPTSLVITPSTSTCVSVHWQDSTPHRKNKTFRLGFQSEWDTGTTWRTCESQKCVIDQYRARVCGLVPGTKYTFRVSSKPVPRGVWSKWTTDNLTTGGDVPASPPEVARGAFVEESCRFGDDCRNVTVFFKPLPDWNKHGKHLEYLLLISRDGNKSSVASNVSSVTIPLSTRMDYLIHLYSKNEFGQSANFSEISIPSVTKKPPFPESVVVERVERPSNVTSYLLSWSPPSGRAWTGSAWSGSAWPGSAWATAGYTLYWCQQLVHATHCTTPLTWKQVSANRTSLGLHFDMSTDRDKLGIYKFGISREVNMNNEIVSSGILWSDCIYKYHKHAKLPDPPDKFRLSPFREDGSLGVTWDKPPCRPTQAYVTYYVIEFCEISNKICSNSKGTVNVTVPNTATSYVIGGLRGDAIYKVTIRSASRAGAGPPSDAVEGTVTYPGLRPEGIAGIIIAAVIFISLIIYCLYRLYQCVKNKLNIPPASYPSMSSRTWNNEVEQEEMYTLFTPVENTENTKDSGNGESDESDELVDVNDRKTFQPDEDSSEKEMDSYAKFAEDLGEADALSHDHVTSDPVGGDFKGMHAHSHLQHDDSCVVGFVLAPQPGTTEQNKVSDVHGSTRTKNRPSPIQNGTNSTQNGCNPIQDESIPIQNRPDSIQYSSSLAHSDVGTMQNEINSAPDVPGRFSPVKHGSSPLENFPDVPDTIVDVLEIIKPDSSGPQHASSLLHEEYVLSSVIDRC